MKRITDMHAEEIQQAVSDVVNSGWYLQGERIARFEQEYAEYTGAKCCVSCANGLDALTMMIRAYKELGCLKDNDEVIVPANTYIATILSITENNLKPVLVEPRIDTLQIDDSMIEEALSEKTKAIMIVHLYGYNAYTDRIGAICKERNLLLLEDWAQSHGLNKVSPPRSKVGKCRGACAHSFYPGKNLGALADAGAMTTDDTEMADVFRVLCNYGSQKKYIFRYKGRNSRMDELSAAVLSVKLKYLDDDNKRRQDIANQYIESIHNSEITFPSRDGVHHIFPILTKRRDEFQDYLKAKGIGTVIHYPIPPHKQECYREWNYLSLPITERIHNEELSIPLNQAMTDEEVQYIIETINDSLHS